MKKINEYTIKTLARNQNTGLTIVKIVFAVNLK